MWKPKPVRTIGVLGGMGPEAAIDFQQKILEETPARRDQDHIPVVVWNNPRIPDRQKAIQGTGPDPLPILKEGVALLNRAGVSVIAIPCNTAHHWYDALAQASAVPILHIADETIHYLDSHVPVDQTIGVLASRAALTSGLYQTRLTARGRSFLASSQEDLDDLIMPGVYAIKQGDANRGGALLHQAADRLADRGAQSLLLACTEIPVGLSAVQSPWLARSLDCARILAKACVALNAEATPFPP